MLEVKPSLYWSFLLGAWTVLYLEANCMGGGEQEVSFHKKNRCDPAWAPGQL